MKRYFFSCLCVLFFAVSGCGKQKSVPDDYCIPDITCDDELGWAVELKLKPQKDNSYLATEDPQIKALIEKHGVIFKQSCPGAKTPELLLLYDLIGKECIDNKNVVKDFLATGKFENEVRVSEIFSINV